MGISPYRPQPFIGTNGKRRLNPLYKSYLSHKLRMTAEERRTWNDLGVKLTGVRERRLACLHETFDFIEGDRA